MVWAWLLQYVIKHTRASRGRSGALAGRVDREGLVLVAPLRAHVAAGLLAFLAPLVLLLGLLGLAALRRASSTRLPFLLSKMTPTASLRKQS
jgi:hypothetical protein